MLTVIVPVYKVENYLDRCVESILRQNYPILEIILVDDGSPDRCPQMCDEWAKKDHRIKVIHQVNMGLSSARNTGLNNAHGEYITFVDSDDLLTDDTYERLRPIIYSYVFDILEYGVKTDAETAKESVLQFQNDTYNNFESYWFATEAYRHCYVWNKVFRRELFDDIRFPEGKVFEDVYIMQQLGRKANIILTTSEGTYLYCMNSSGISKQITRKHIEDHLQAHMQLLPYLLNNYPKLHVDKKQISLYYIYVFNIQITHWHLTRETPIIPNFHPSIILDKGLSIFIKSILMQVLSPSLICRLFCFWKHKP